MISISASVALLLVAGLAMGAYVVDVESDPALDPKKMFREMFDETTPLERLPVLIRKVSDLFKGGDLSILSMAKSISTEQALVVYDRFAYSRIEDKDMLVLINLLTEMNPEIFYPIVMGDLRLFDLDKLLVEQPDLRESFKQDLKNLPPVVIAAALALAQKLNPNHVLPMTCFSQYPEPFRSFSNPQLIGTKSLLFTLAGVSVKTPDGGKRHVLSDYTTIKALLHLGIRFPVADFLVRLPLSVSEFQTVVPLLSPRCFEMCVQVPFQNKAIVVYQTWRSSSVLAILKGQHARYAAIFGISSSRDLTTGRSYVKLQDLMELELPELLGLGLPDLLQDVFVGLVRDRNVDLSLAANTCAQLIFRRPRPARGPVHVHRQRRRRLDEDRALPHVSLYREAEGGFCPIYYLFHRLPRSAAVLSHPVFLDKVLAEPARFQNYIFSFFPRHRQYMVDFFMDEYLKGYPRDGRLLQVAILLSH